MTKVKRSEEVWAEEIGFQIYRVIVNGLTRKTFKGSGAEFRADELTRKLKGITKKKRGTN